MWKKWVQQIVGEITTSQIRNHPSETRNDPSVCKNASTRESFRHEKMDSRSAGIGALVLEVWTCVLSLTQLKAFNQWWCSVEIPSWRSHECAFCPHDILSSGLLCYALCSKTQVLCTSCPPRLHGHVLQHCVCVVRAWLLMFSRPRLGWEQTTSRFS